VSILCLDYLWSLEWRGVKRGVYQLAQIFFRSKDLRIDFFEECKVSHELLGQSRDCICEVCDRGEDLDRLFFQPAADGPSWAKGSSA
jgi:hypothetical protein